MGRPTPDAPAAVPLPESSPSIPAPPFRCDRCDEPFENGWHFTSESPKELCAFAGGSKVSIKRVYRLCFICGPDAHQDLESWKNNGEGLRRLREKRDAKARGEDLFEPDMFAPE